MAAKRKRVGHAFGAALREARAASEITQEELADRADYTPRFVSLLETSRREPTISAILSIEVALGIAPGELVRRTHALLGPRGKRVR